jgi:hypothetical protein
MLRQILVDQLFNSKAARQVTVAIGEFRQRGPAGTNHDKDQSRSARRDDRNDSIAREPLHEQVSRIGVHRLQRPSRGTQLPAQCRFERAWAHRGAYGLRSASATIRPRKADQTVGKQVGFRMSDKQPIPCEHCKAKGLFGGDQCRECGGRGYRLVSDGRVSPSKFERSGVTRRRRRRSQENALRGAH